MMSITKNEIHLWLAFPDEISDTALIERYRTLLSDEEISRMERFKFQRDQHTHLVSRALMRTVLTGYTGTDPDRWRFRTNAYGKPEIEKPMPDIPLKFNLSHTNELIIFAVALEVDIGVDAESTKRRALDDEFVNRYFARGEVAELRKSPEQWVDRFFEFWTLKEAYIKAKGMGLSIPLDSFCFGMPGHHGLTITFETGATDTPDHWHFWLMEPTAHHKASIGYRSPSGQTKRLSAFKIVPMLEAIPCRCKVIRQTS